MAEIRFQVVAQVDGDPVPDLSGDLFRHLSRAVGAIDAGDGLDSISLAGVEVILDSPDAFNLDERREYAAMSAVLAEASLSLPFHGFSEPQWRHDGQQATRRLNRISEEQPDEVQVRFIRNSATAREIIIFNGERPVLERTLDISEDYLEP